MVWHNSRVNDTFKSIFDLWAGNVEKSLGKVMDWSSHCLFMLPISPPFLFMRYLFCHILAMKRVAMERKHTKEPALWMQLIPTFAGYHQTIAIFKETMQTDKGGEGESMYCKLTQNSITKEGPWGWLTKWQKKTPSLLSGHVILLSPWHNQRDWERLSACFVRWIRSPPTEHNLCKGRWLCLCWQRVCFYLVYTGTSKMTFRIRLFTTAKLLNMMGLKSALVLSCYPNEICNDDLNYRYIDQVNSLLI